MKKSVWLYVHFNENVEESIYSATLLFAKNYNTQEVYQQMVNEGKTKITLEEETEFEEGTKEIIVEIMEFGSVDLNFYKFVQNNFFDDSVLEKHKLFYVGEIESN